MADWKIVVTLLVVLAVIAAFAGSAPGVSAFFREVGSRIGGFFSNLGLGLPSGGENQFSLELTAFNRIDFSMSRGKIVLKGPAEARVDRGTIKFADASATGFSGTGSVSPAITINGSADSLEFDSSRLEKVRLELSSEIPELFAANVSIASLAQDNVQGGLVLNGSVTKFSGRIEVRGFYGDFFWGNGSLRLEGHAGYIAVPGAGIRVG